MPILEPELSRGWSDLPSGYRGLFFKYPLLPGSLFSPESRFFARSMIALDTRFPM